MTLVSYPEIRREAGLPVYVTGIEVENRTVNVRRLTLTNPELVVILQGRGQIALGGELVRLEPGSVFFLNRKVECLTRPSLDERWVLDWISFGFGSETLQDMLFTAKPYALFSPQEGKRAHEAMLRIYDLLSLDSRYGGFAASTELYELLIELHRAYLGIPERGQKNEAVIGAVVSCINERYREDITLEELCAAAGGLSEQYLCRLFKEYTGLRPVEFILKKRIGIAKSLLEKTDMPIAEIAETVGFHNASYFYRNFKKFTRTSPLNYRMNVQGEAEEE